MSFKTFTLVLLAGFVAALAAPVAASAADGKALFIEQKCNKCHRVTSAKIDPIKEKDDIVDLSGTGDKHDRDFFPKWLKKEIEKESIVTPGKQVKHKRQKWGDDDSAEDLTVLVDWLTTLKK